MKRLTDDQKSKIQLLAKTKSLKKIAKEMSLSKTTVHYWYLRYSNHVPPKKIRIDYTDEDKIGEFVGAFAGDGNYTSDKGYQHQIRIYLTAEDVGYVKHLKTLMTSLFNKTPWEYTEDEKNVTQLRMVSKDLIDFLRTYLAWEHTKTKTVRLINRAKASKAFRIGYLRGLMDTDGTIKNKYCAIFSTISERLAKDIEYSLESLGITYNTLLQIDKRPNQSPIFRIRITKDRQKFINIINPYHK